MRRRSIIAACILLFLVLVLAALWSGFDWPPPRLVLKYGFPPTGGPTGRTMTIEGVEFVALKPSYFRMGSHFLCKEGDLLGRVCAVLRLPWGKQPRHDSNECPPHWVEIERGFWIARTEITNEQYERFDPTHRRDWADDHSPVTSVTWAEANAYCLWLAKGIGSAARLPSEAEWESACRAGSNTEFCFGEDEGDLREFAWYSWYQRTGDSGGRAHQVKTRRPNAWGLYDLHGNVDEWCEDIWHDDYRGAPQDASAWRTGDSPFCVSRGGNWFHPVRYCRSAFRGEFGPQHRADFLGFRPVCSTP